MEAEEQEVRLCGKIEPSPIGKGSKRTRNPDKWAKNVKKQKLYSSKSLPKKPNCNHKAKIFKCNTLGMQDIRKFHQGFYAVKDKSYQDNFILKNSDSEKPKRERAREERKEENEVWNRYYIPVATGGRVQICKQAFCFILGINPKRVQRVCKRHFFSGELATEKRGGDHRSSKMENCRQAVRQFIENLVPIESHYCRNTKKIRQYLASDVTITKLWKSYNNSFDSDELKVEYEFFRNIFNTEYNIGFGSPATDVCSKCIQLKELAKTDKKHEVEYKVHKARAKTFFKLLQHKEDNKIVFSFDCQKNLVLPKLPDQATYYSRQLYLNNFTICLGTSKDKQDKESVFIYTWTEADYQKGSNQIASAVYHRLCNTNLDGYSHVRLFADGCGGQNKNSIITFMLSYWLCESAPHNTESVQLIFPVPGHSFMPPDRVFGRVEKELKRFDTIIKPEEYWDIFENHGTVIKVKDDNIDVFDWKESSCLYQKPPKDWHFQFSPCKRFIFTRGRTPSAPVLVRGEVAYSTDCGRSKKVIKPGVDIRSLQVAKINPGNALKPAKVADVKRLLALHFGDEWKTRPDLKYYSDTLFDREMQEYIEPEDEEEGGHMEEVEGIV